MSFKVGDIVMSLLKWDEKGGKECEVVEILCESDEKKQSVRVKYSNGNETCWISSSKFEEKK